MEKREGWQKGMRLGERQEGEGRKREEQRWGRDGERKNKEGVMNWSGEVRGGAEAEREHKEGEGKGTGRVKRGN